MAHAAHRFADRAEAWLVAIRPGLAEARQAQQDQARIDGGQRVVAEAPFFQRAGAKILDDDVGIAGEPAHDLLAFGDAQVRGDRFLVARLDVPPERRALVQQPPLPQRIAAVGRFDLDDLGAELGQDLARERARDQLTELEDLEPGQRPGVGCGFGHRSGRQMLPLARLARSAPSRCGSLSAIALPI